MRACILKEYGQEHAQECEQLIIECLRKRDFITVCNLGAGGSEAEIDGCILRALMTGMSISTGWIELNKINLIGRFNFI